MAGYTELAPGDLKTKQGNMEAHSWAMPAPLGRSRADGVFSVNVSIWRSLKAEAVRDRYWKAGGRRRREGGF